MKIQKRNTTSNTNNRGFTVFAKVLEVGKQINIDGVSRNAIEVEQISGLNAGKKITVVSLKDVNPEMKGVGLDSDGLTTLKIKPGVNIALRNSHYLDADRSQIEVRRVTKVGQDFRPEHSLAVYATLRETGNGRWQTSIEAKTLIPKHGVHGEFNGEISSDEKKRAILTDIKTVLENTQRAYDEALQNVKEKEALLDQAYAEKDKDKIDALTESVEFAKRQAEDYKHAGIMLIVNAQDEESGETFTLQESFSRLVLKDNQSANENEWSVLSIPEFIDKAKENLDNEKRALNAFDGIHLSAKHNDVFEAEFKYAVVPASNAMLTKFLFQADDSEKREGYILTGVSPVGISYSSEGFVNSGALEALNMLSPFGKATDRNEKIKNEADKAVSPERLPLPQEVVFQRITTQIDMLNGLLNEQAEQAQNKAEQEPPKQESPKQESPKQESPKQESPKQEAPKQEAPKQEDPDDPWNGFGPDDLDMAP